MKENLIYEGNTIYELDPECIWEKEKKKQQDKSQRGKRRRKQSLGMGLEQGNSNRRR